MTRPKPIEKEIILDPAKTIMSKTDPQGIIEYANEYFIEVCGYEEYELMGQPHNIIRHPDMPKIIFKMLWERLGEGKKMYAFVKNLAKDGRYYWVLAHFKSKYDKAGKIVSYFAFRKAAPKMAVLEIENLYKTLLLIEKNQGIETSEKYFLSLLEDKNVDYDTFILQLLKTDMPTLERYFAFSNKPETPKKKQGFLKRLFS